MMEPQEPDMDRIIDIYYNVLKKAGLIANFEDCHEEVDSFEP
jgi:hypothetical protein